MAISSNPKANNLRSLTCKKYIYQGCNVLAMSAIDGITKDLTRFLIFFLFAFELHAQLIFDRTRLQNMQSNCNYVMSESLTSNCLHLRVYVCVQLLKYSLRARLDDQFLYPSIQTIRKRLRWLHPGVV